MEEKIIVSLSFPFHSIVFQGVIDKQKIVS